MRYKKKLVERSRNSAVNLVNISKIQSEKKPAKETDRALEAAVIENPQCKTDPGKRLLSSIQED